MSFQAVLTYTSLVGYQPFIATRNRIAALDLKIAETADALGFDVTSQVTAVVGSTVEKQVTLTTNALGDRLWYTADQVKAIVTKLFRGALNMQIPSLVISATPVVT